MVMADIRELEGAGTLRQWDFPTGPQGAKKASSLPPETQFHMANITHKGNPVTTIGELFLSAP